MKADKLEISLSVGCILVYNNGLLVFVFVLDLAVFALSGEEKSLRNGSDIACSGLIDTYMDDD